MSLSVSLSIKKNTMFARLKGEMDESSTSQLRGKFNEIIGKYNIENVVFNMRDLSFMDSSGIGLILGRYNQIQNKNGRIIICEMNKNIEKVIFLSGLLKICTVKDTEESAKWFLGVEQ